MQKFLTGLAAALIVLHASGIAADTTARPISDLVDEQELLDIVRSVHRKQENTGLVFKLSVRGQRVLEDFTGTAVIEHDVPVTPQSRFTFSISSRRTPHAWPMNRCRWPSNPEATTATRAPATT